jgi:hypothetical protein
MGQRRAREAVTKVLASAEQMTADKPADVRGKRRLCTIERLDGRTVAARRARELAKGFEAELGGTITTSQRFAIERAAALVALAEDAKARRLAGDAAITLEDVVRVDNSAARAVKALGIKPGVAPKPPSIHEFMASLKPAPTVAQPSAGPTEEPAVDKAHEQPSLEDGGPSGEPPP